MRAETTRRALDAPEPMDPETPYANETEFVERLRGGNEDACETLVRTQTGRLLVVARRYLRREEDARDAVQEAFVAAFRSIGRFQGGSSVSTWLHRIVINACLMKLRSGRRHPESSIEELLPKFDESGHRIAEPEEWRESPETALLRSQTRRCVREAIERLPEHYRSVLLLRDIEELPTSEVAQMLNLSTNAVKIRLHRARQALRTLLASAVREGELVL